MNIVDVDMSKIAEDILDSGISPSPQEYQGLGCDNMSCIVIKLNYQAVGEEVAPECPENESVPLIE